MSTSPPTAARHPFVRSPNRTLVGLSIPILFSLIAEPITGMVDTACVARLGSGALSALGVATILLSSVFWIFNFLGVATQTEVAHELGADRRDEARGICTLALLLAGFFGVALAALGFLVGDPLIRFMGAADEVRDGALVYLEIRLLSTPAILLTLTSFGALRGLQRMGLPLAISVVVNALNVILDFALIFGWGPIPALGIAGAAWATVIAQWLGATLSLLAIRSALGFSGTLPFARIPDLLVVGRDLFIRTGVLTLFLLLGTRCATRIGADAGAAHQAVRQVWFFTALLLDAFAATGQSLIGFFLGAADRRQARRVAGYVCGWSLGTGGVLTMLMLATGSWVATLLAPPAAHPAFFACWVIAALSQPFNAVSFATDGIHWGTRDYSYLRNAMVVATGVGAVLLVSLDLDATGALTRVWWVTLLWIALRSILGWVRIWPGLGTAPLRRS